MPEIERYGLDLWRSRTILETKPTVGRITIYPVKSLDGVSLQKARVGNGGCLLHDREYAIVDSSGNFINGKSNEQVHRLRSQVDLGNNIISFRHQEEVSWKNFHLQNEIAAINIYLSEFFGTRAALLKNTEGRFMDIPDIAGITAVSTASLETVTSWFADMDIEETRKRFRATIEIRNVPAFWEDRLFFEEGTAVKFKAGEITFLGISPRARCVVPTRHPETGEVIHGFPKTFARQRTETLPEWSTLSDYGHAYYLTVNCFIPATEFDKQIEVGDEVKIIGKQKISTFTE